MIDYSVNDDIASSRIESALMDNADCRILDVGGAYNICVYATHVIDLMPRPAGCRIKSQNWKDNYDVCNTPWPYPDKYFDYVWCTQTVEDLRDPISVVKEMSRVGKCGYISSIDRDYESQLGVNNPEYAGYIHHRWLVEPYSIRELRFIYKYPILHVKSDEYRPVCDMTDIFFNCWWDNEIDAHELFFTSIEHVETYFRDYANKTKGIT